jgi:hypothetical protein
VTRITPNVRAGKSSRSSNPLFRGISTSRNTNSGAFRRIAFLPASAESASATIVTSGQYLSIERRIAIRLVPSSSMTTAVSLGWVSGGGIDMSAVRDDRAIVYRSIPLSGSTGWGTALRLSGWQDW